MTNTTHTPAPWHVIDGTICDNYGQDIIGPVLFDSFPDEHQANARLISAAPDLLEASLAAYRALTLDSDMEDDFAPEIAALTAAIAKARGQ